MAQVDESIFLFKSDPTKGKVRFFSTDKNRSMMKHFYVLQHSIPQCVYTESQAFLMKIPTAYHEAPTIKFRLF